MKLKNVNDKIQLYEFMAIDEILYSFEAKGDHILIKGGNIKPFVLLKNDLDEIDPNRKILLEIIKKYYKLQDDMDFDETILYIHHNRIHPNNQLRTIVLLAYQEELMKVLEQSNKWWKYKLVGIIAILSILICIILYFIYRYYKDIK